jgi:hypothetical protein
MMLDHHLPEPLSWQADHEVFPELTIFPADRTPA